MDNARNDFPSFDEFVAFLLLDGAPVLQQDGGVPGVRLLDDFMLLGGLDFLHPREVCRLRLVHTGLNESVTKLWMQNAVLVPPISSKPANVHFTRLVLQDEDSFVKLLRVPAAALETVDTLDIRSGAWPTFPLNNTVWKPGNVRNLDLKMRRDLLRLRHVRLSHHYLPLRFFKTVLPSLPPSLDVLELRRATAGTRVVHKNHNQKDKIRDSNVGPRGPESGQTSVSATKTLVIDHRFVRLLPTLLSHYVAVSNKIVVHVASTSPCKENLLLNGLMGTKGTVLQLSSPDLLADKVKEYLVKQGRPCPFRVEVVCGAARPSKKPSYKVTRRLQGLARVRSLLKDAEDPDEEEVLSALKGVFSKRVVGWSSLSPDRIEVKLESGRSAVYTLTNSDDVSEPPLKRLNKSQIEG